MPLTKKIPKLDTQKLFDEMVVLESEVAGLIDGSLGLMTDSDKMDEYWEIYTTRLANMIDDYIVGKEIVGDTSAPLTKLAPGLVDTYGSFTTTPGSVTPDSDRGRFEGTFIHLGFIPGFTTKHDKVRQKNLIENPGQYFIETNSPPPVEQPEPVVVDNPDFDPDEHTSLEDDMNKKDDKWRKLKKEHDAKLIKTNASKKKWQDAKKKWEDAKEEFNEYDSIPRTMDVETEAPPEPASTMEGITGIHLSRNDKSGREYDLTEIPGKSKLEIKQGSNKGIYIIETIEDNGTYISFTLLPADVGQPNPGSLITSGNIDLSWESTSGSPAKVQLQKDLFEIYSRSAPEGETPEESIRIFSEGFADALDKYMEEGSVLLISDTPDIRIDKNIPSVGPIVPTGKTNSEGIPVPLSTMGVGLAKVVDREEAKEHLIENLIKFLSTINGRIGYYGETPEIIDHFCNQFIDSIHIYIVTCPVVGEHIIPLLVFMPGTLTSDTLTTPAGPVPNTPGVTLVPWPIVPLSSRGEMGYEVFDGAKGGFTPDINWIEIQSEKFDIWNDTVFKNHEEIFIIENLQEIDNITATAGVRG
jgi:hypothetical protein